MNTEQPQDQGDIKLNYSEGDGVAEVVLTHPGRLNAITVGMWRKLTEVFRALPEHQGLRVVVIRGEGSDFAAGADIREFVHYRRNFADVMNYHTRILAPALNAIAQCPLPVVAAIRGVCVGGGLEIACQCDLRIASSEARFGVPINRLGFPMAPDEMQGLLSLVGPATTLEILLEGEIFDATEAKAKGLLTRVIEPAHFDAHLKQTLTRLARAAPLAAQINKETVRRLTHSDRPLARAELDRFFRYATTKDHHEGVQAFLAGRTPSFTGE